MNLTEPDITGAVARELREKTGLSQRAFWEPLGVHQSSGCQYESSASAIPKPVRILLVARYVAGLDIDASTHQGVASLTNLAPIQSNPADVKALARTMCTTLTTAAQGLQAAADALQTI